MALLGSVWLPELRIQGGEDLDLNFTLKLEVENVRALGSAGKHFVQANRTAWEVRAELDVKAWILGFIPVYISGIPVEKRVELRGMAGFSQAVNPVTMQGLTHAYGSSGALNVTVNVSLFNPSYIAAYVAPAVTLNVTQRGKIFGVASLHGVRLQPGHNWVLLDFLMEQTPDNVEAIQGFILGFISAEHVQPVTVRGTSLSTSDTLLRAVFRDLNMTFDFRPPKTEFIRNIDASLGFSGLRAEAVIYNPLPQLITMGTVDIMVLDRNASGQHIFHLGPNELSGLVLQPHTSSALSFGISPFGARLGNLDLIMRLFQQAMQGEVVVGVDGPVDITIHPSFNMTVRYRGSNIKASLHCPVICGRRRRPFLRQLVRA